MGRIAESLSLERRKTGRREVYVVELKQQGDKHEIVKIIRLQKWDVSDRLDRGKTLLEAMIESEEYTDYVLDRRLGCRRLTMNLPGALVTSKIREIYRGEQTSLHDTQIWTPYFERDYVRGTATDKLPAERLQRDGYALRFAELLGRAAAPNMIVGRCGDDGHVFFDDGDEVIIEDERRASRRTDRHPSHGLVRRLSRGPVPLRRRVCRSRERSRCLRSRSPRLSRNLPRVVRPQFPAHSGGIPTPSESLQYAVPASAVRPGRAASLSAGSAC